MDARYEAMHLIRHGQSHFNVAINKTGRDPGIIDASLTDAGFAQAEAAAVKLIGQGIEEIICSPYTRALQTASVIAGKLNVPIHVEPFAGERSLYACDIGTPTSRLKEAWQHLDFSALEKENWWPEIEESHAGLRGRAVAFLDKWGDHLESRRFALVSHWYFLNHVSGYDFENGEVRFKKLL